MASKRVWNAWVCFEDDGTLSAFRKVIDLATGCRKYPDSGGEVCARRPTNVRYRLVEIREVTRRTAKPAKPATTRRASGGTRPGASGGRR